MNNSKIVEAIKKLCESHSMSVSSLEGKLGFSQGLISRWNKTDPSINKIIEIANYFNVSIDQVIGRDIVNDEFLEKVIFATKEKKIAWKQYDISISEPKQYQEDKLGIEFITEDKELRVEKSSCVSYYAQIVSGFVSIYARYIQGNILNPQDLILFVQPNIESDLIKQNYNYSQLLTLWTEILYSLNEVAPDEVKAEELKRAFVATMK